jgi:hypothetical protein
MELINHFYEFVLIKKDFMALITDFAPRRGCNYIFPISQFERESFPCVSLRAPTKREEKFFISM